MLRSLKVAIPFTAFMLNVPASVAVPAEGSVSKPTVTVLFASDTKLLEASLISTVSAGEIVDPLNASVGP